MRPTSDWAHQWGVGLSEREDELIRNGDWAAEQAGRALLDNALDYAIIWSDRAVTATRTLLERYRRKYATDERFIEVFSERIWDRAIIHQGLGNTDAAIRDGTEALALIEESERTHGVKYPLRGPSVRLLLCELHAKADDMEAARRYGQAIDAYRQQLDEPSLLLATGFARYGWAMDAIGDPSAPEALRQAVDLFRSPAVRLIERSDVERFVQTAMRVVENAEPAAVDSAPEILPILRDAAGWAVRLVPASYPAFVTADAHADARAALDILDRLGAWLRVWGAPKLAAYYERLAAVFPRGLGGPIFWSQMHSAVADAERLVDEAIRLRRDPPQTPDYDGSDD